VAVLAVLAAAVPFAFGLIRLVQTGSDSRYLVVAAASLVGAVVATRLARIGTVAVVFLASTVFAVVAAMLLGTHLGPGILVVAASFGSCFAVAAALRGRATKSRERASSI